ncbi:hypothetical protein AXF42_Ash018378 [Apostasia shenzhenica]|uniref:Uncharacterized protein n=1 Tax=Apostasia shenzhenica TaxID=1088818 RepID=A0A2H9ZRC0_9ASPA|nr:hypothetical protein AXF42_Ash018378 [Apostasia shenzhenica]
MKPTAVKLSASPAPRRGTGRQEKPAAVAAAGTMGRPSSFSSPPILSRLFHFLLSLAPLFFLSSSHPTPFPDVSVENPIVQLTASVSDGNLNERIRVCGTSRLNWKSYANSLYVLVKASEEMPHRHYGNVGICIHRNASLGIGQCKDDDWRSLQKSEWKYVMSPYDTRFIDVKSRGQVSGSIIVSVEEEFQQWRWICLGAGFVLMLLAPIVSNWVPFYYSSSMALGVLLVILLILFQGMKLLPTGRKNILYLTLYGSVLGVGSYIAHYFSTIVNSILVSFGLSEEMHNPVSVFLLVGIVLAGAALGYWIVRKYVLSEDGTIDVGIAQFVKWAMRIIAVVLILQSSFDALLAVIALGVCWSFCSLISSLGWSSPSALRKGHLKSANLWQQKAWQASGITRHAEFLNRSANMVSGQPIWGSPSSFSRLSISPMTGQTSSTPNRNSTSSMRNRAQSSDFYSSFHKTPTTKFSKMEWEDFTRESTREALADWASTPEVSKWIANNAHRMRLANDSSSDDTMESSSGSSEETAVDDGGNNGLRLFKWSLGFSA